MAGRLKAGLERGADIADLWAGMADEDRIPLAANWMRRLAKAMRLEAEQDQGGDTERVQISVCPHCGQKSVVL